jgi:hypothetical protein
MALYVRADDGLYYPDPALWGPTWFLQFTEEALACFYLTRGAGEDFLTATARAKAVLEEIGLAVFALPHPESCTALFWSGPPKGRPAWVFGLELRGPLPTLFLPPGSAGRGCAEPPARGPHRVYGRDVG